jgi:hypothetical protein
MLARIASLAISIWLLVAVFSCTRVFADQQPAIAVVNVGNVDAPEKWTAGPPRWVGTNLFSFYDNETQVGETFYIEVQLDGAVDLFAWQFQLSFDPNLIECVGAWRPSHHIFEAHTSILVPPFINNEQGYVLCGSTLLDGDSGVSGDGTLAQVGFQILKAPQANETLTSDLSFVHPDAHNAGTYVVLTNGEVVDVQNTDGRYEYHDPAILGDVNGDGKVDITDVALTSAAFGSYPNRPKWNPACDINRDGKVDIQDLSRVSAYFGKFHPL